MNRYRLRKLKRELIWLAFIMLFAVVMMVAFAPRFSGWVQALADSAMAPRR